MSETDLATELLSYYSAWMLKNYMNLLFMPSSQHRQSPSPKPSQQDGKSKITKAKKQYVTNNG